MVAVALDAVAVYDVGVDAVELGTIAVTTSTVLLLRIPGPWL